MVAAAVELGICAAVALLAYRAGQRRGVERARRSLQQWDRRPPVGLAPIGSMAACGERVTLIRPD